MIIISYLNDRCMISIFFVNFLMNVQSEIHKLLSICIKGIKGMIPWNPPLPVLPAEWSNQCTSKATHGHALPPL